ncbi:substrate-binding periplasmic protein [Paludibacterium paludis]|uniref:ABC transporter substrate-binding protein n=1 Tax=Paludibacterium paludis TaxID=1225769 RepID=A0A918NXP0_9NEIS|nr:transporter substrate-binding domain-containing protein [Paludibacterium paludis]GGY03533.1 ABC transporter substrate-binding protein [Paludibacterium paludis]
MKAGTLFLAGLFALLFQAGTHAACDRPWRVGVYDHLPFQGFTARGEPTGIEVDLVKLAAARSGCQVRFESIPWKRQLSYAERGAVDFVMGAGKRKDREAYLYYFEPYIYEPSVFIQLEKAARLHPLTSLQGITREKESFMVAALNGASYSQSYDELLKNPDFVRHLSYTPSNEISVRLLLAGRVDIALFADLHEPDEIFRRLGIREKIRIYPVDESSREDEYAYFAFSKKALDDVRAGEINAAIIAITRSPAFEAMLLKYFTDSEIRVLTRNADKR